MLMAFIIYFFIEVVIKSYYIISEKKTSTFLLQKYEK